LISHKIIQIKLPVNLKSVYTKLFVNQQRYKLKSLKVKKLKNVFVSHYGLCIKNYLLVPRSAPNLKGTKDKTFYYSFWRLAIEQYFVCKYGKSLKSINLDDNKNYLLIHSKWFGYFFWITQCIPRLLAVQSSLNNYVLLYPEDWKNLKYVNESLLLFPDLQKIVIPSDNHLFVKNLILPLVQPWTASFDPDIVDKVRNLFHEYLEKSNIDFSQGEFIYATRQNTKHRMLVNENDVQNLLSEYKFKTIDFEKFNFFEQISIMKNAKIFVSIHGAGFANINFMKKGGSTLEFVNEEYAKKDYRFQFWKLSSVAGLNPYIQFCKSENNPEIPIFVNNNIYVDLNELKNNIELIIKNLKE
jgi:hypothetical protein